MNPEKKIIDQFVDDTYYKIFNQSFPKRIVCGIIAENCREKWIENIDEIFYERMLSHIVVQKSDEIKDEDYDENSEKG